MPTRTLFEKITVPADGSIALREFKAARFTMPWHFHPELELTWIIKGRGTRYVGDSIETFDEGDVVLIGSNLPHFWWSDPGSGRAHSLVMQFAPDLLGAGWLDLPEAGEVRRLLARAARGLLVRGAARRRVTESLGAMQRLSPWRRLVALLDLLGVLSADAGLRPLASAGFAPVLDATDGSRMAAVCRYVNEQFSEDIGQTQAAQLAHLSPSAFSRYFRRRMGRTFEAYVNEVRIGQVCRRLLDPDCSVSEAAYAAGYNNLANFNRRFRQITGMTPSQFRTRHRAARPSG